jgi:hypothetical protein
MRLYLVFIVGAFVVGGMARRWPWARRPLTVLAVCVIVGAAFYSRRVI